MAVFKVIKAISGGTGYLKGPDGSMVPVQDLIPKPGDTVTGEIEVSNFGNKDERGITVAISTGLKGQEGSTLIFISEEYLELVSPAKSGAKTLFTGKNIAIILIIASAVILYFRMKK